MKIVNFCRDGSYCPVVKVDDQQVEIGETGNSCILNNDGWEILKQKIIDGEL